MARGDFRSSIGQVISGSQRQIHNTSGTVPAFRPVRQSPNYIAEGALNAVGMVAKTLQDNKRQQEIEAERQKRKAEAEAEREKRKKEAHRKGLDNHLYGKRYRANQEAMTQFVAHVAQTSPNDVYLSDAEFREKYADQLTTVNLEDIEDEYILDIAKLNEQEDLSILLNAARNGVEQAAELRKYVALTDMSADENFADIEEIYAAGSERGMSDEKIFTALTSSAYSSASQGNYDAAAVVKQFAIDKIKDPQLRDQIIGEMEPLVARGARQKVEMTKEARRALNGARTLSEIDEVLSQFPEGTFDEGRVEKFTKEAEARQYRQRFIDTATSDFKNGNVSLDTLYDRLSGEQVIDGERTRLEHRIKLTRDEINQHMDLAILELASTNPQAVPEILKKSNRVPRVFSDAITSFFAQAGTAKEMKDVTFDGNEYEFVLHAINSVDGIENPYGSAAPFIAKYGLEGSSKAAAQLMFSHLAYMKASGNLNVQEAIEKGFEPIIRNNSNDSLVPTQAYTTELNTQLSDDEYPPEVRTLARQYIQSYISYMRPQAAAKAAIDNAMAMTVEVGDRYIMNGRDLLSAMEDVNTGILKDYSDVDTNDVIESIVDGLDFTPAWGTFVPYKLTGSDEVNVDISEIHLADENGNVIRYTLREVREMVQDKFADRRYDTLLKRNDTLRGEVAENMPLSMRPDLYQPSKF